MNSIFNSWRVTTIVSALQFLLGAAMYWMFGSVAIASATVGSCTFMALFPVVEGEVLEYCPRMWGIIGDAVLAAFAIATIAGAVHFFLLDASYIGKYFFASFGLAFVALLLLVVIFAGALMSTVKYHQEFGTMQEPSSVITICLLPAGIGLLFGAFYFSIQHYRRRVPVL